MRKRTLNQQAIVEISPGDVVYINLRSYGVTWYTSLHALPDRFHTVYYVQHRYDSWVNKSRRKINIVCDLFRESYAVDHDYVVRYGLIQDVTPSDGAVLIDEQYCQLYPDILPDATRGSLIKQYKRTHPLPPKIVSYA